MKKINQTDDYIPDVKPSTVTERTNEDVNDTVERVGSKDQQMPFDEN